MTEPAIERINIPGIYDMPAERYHADPVETPSLNNSVGKVLLNASPAHAYLAHPRLGGRPNFSPTSRMNLGSAAHSVILERTWDPIVFIDANDFRTKAAQAERDEALEAGKIPLLAKERFKVEGMVRAIEESGVFAGKADYMAYERTYIWQDHQDAWARCRIDAVYSSPDEEQPDIIYDLKTTELRATPRGWGRTQIWDYALQAAWYSEGHSTITGRGCQFVFVVQETKAPYSVRPFRFDTTSMAYGESLAAQAADTWHRCMETGKWPSYPHDTHVVRAPQYILDYLERERVG